MQTEFRFARTAVASATKLVPGTRYPPSPQPDRAVQQQHRELQPLQAVEPGCTDDFPNTVG